MGRAFRCDVCGQFSDLDAANNGIHTYCSITGKKGNAYMLEGMTVRADITIYNKIGADLCYSCFIKALKGAIIELGANDG